MKEKNIPIIILPIEKAEISPVTIVDNGSGNTYKTLFEKVAGLLMI